MFLLYCASSLSSWLFIFNVFRRGKNSFSGFYAPNTKHRSARCRVLVVQQAATLLSVGIICLPFFFFRCIILFYNIIVVLVLENKIRGQKYFVVYFGQGCQIYFYFRASVRTRVMIRHCLTRTQNKCIFVVFLNYRLLSIKLRKIGRYTDNNRCPAVSVFTLFPCFVLLFSFSRTVLRHPTIIFSFCSFDVFCK